jgi:CheY-like chemotaxis protein
VELLSKPYSRQQLAVKVRHVLGDSDCDSKVIEQPVAESSDDPGGPVGHLAELRVLAVDDDRASLDALCEVLQLLGIAARRAENATAALEVLEAGDFDVLLTDVVMPDMSGLELARRATTMHSDLKVIFASGNRLPDQETLGFDWSALRKPYTLAQLHDTLKSAGNRQEKRKAGGGDAGRVRGRDDEQQS